MKSLLDAINNLIVDCRDTLKAIDRSERRELPVTICPCGAPTENGKLCTKCEREGKSA